MAQDRIIIVPLRDRYAVVVQRWVPEARTFMDDRRTKPVVRTDLADAVKVVKEIASGRRPDQEVL
jgi:hypothetical protein